MVYMARQSHGAHSSIEQLRKPVSWVFAILFLCAFAFTTAPKPVWGAVMCEAMGLLCVVAGGLGRLWCMLHIAGHKNTALQIGGPYSVSRNPLYFFSFMALLGVSVYSQKILLALIVTAIYLIYYEFVIAGEEKRLTKLFGKPYENYLKSVPRFWPNLSLYKTPDVVQVDPKLMIKASADVVWFYMIIVLLDAIDRLQVAGILPLMYQWPF